MPTTYLEIDMGYETPCHVWQGARSREGYALQEVRGRTRLVHKRKWEDEHQVRLANDHRARLHHRCEVKPCVRIDHLELMTQGDHIRGHRKGKPQVGGAKARAAK